MVPGEGMRVVRGKGGSQFVELGPPHDGGVTKWDEVNIGALKYHFDELGRTETVGLSVIQRGCGLWLLASHHSPIWQYVELKDPSRDVWLKVCFPLPSDVRLLA